MRKKALAISTPNKGFPVPNRLEAIQRKSLAIPKNVLSGQELSRRVKPVPYRESANAFKTSRSDTAKSKSNLRIEDTPRLRISRHSNRRAPRNTRERKVRSKIRWFTEFCNSHYLSQFAAFFIDARAKRSVVKSCINIWPCGSINIQGSIKVFVRIPLGRTTEGPLQKKYKVHRCEWIRGVSTCRWMPASTPVNSLMILPQVHLRKPCYDFYFL